MNTPDSTRIEQLERVVGVLTESLIKVLTVQHLLVPRPVEEKRQDAKTPSEADDRGEWPTLAAQYNMYLLDCTECGVVEPMTFDAWCRKQERDLTNDPDDLAHIARAEAPAPMPGTLQVRGRALHAGAPAVADVDFTTAETQP